MSTQQHTQGASDRAPIYIASHPAEVNNGPKKDEMNDRVRIFDTTLRDGEQSPGF